MNNIIIIILGIILLVLIILNHITIVKTPQQGNCSQTAFGCCPDGVNSKVNFYGTNCPAYKPGPGYYPNQPPPGPGPIPA